MAKHSDVKILSVRLDKQCAIRLETMVKLANLSTSDLVRDAIDFYMQNHKVSEVQTVNHVITRLSA